MLFSSVGIQRIYSFPPIILIYIYIYIYIERERERLREERERWGVRHFDKNHYEKSHKTSVLYLLFCNSFDHHFSHQYTGYGKHAYRK